MTDSLPDLAKRMKRLQELFPVRDIIDEFESAVAGEVIELIHGQIPQQCDSVDIRSPRHRCDLVKGHSGIHISTTGARTIGWADEGSVSFEHDEPTT